MVAFSRQIDFRRVMQNFEQVLLSTRQGEIAQLVISGKSTREIALKLTLSPRTIETHIAAIYNKYGVSSRAELILVILGRSAVAGLSPTFPATDVTQTNLPIRRAALVGRATDIETIVGISRAKQLVTITGAGGIGKTQVALAVGEAVLDEFPGGVWLVELATLAHGSPVVEAVARALSVQRSKDLALIDSLVAHLKRKTLLLIIDNCEHVINEVATLADLFMRSCPRLQVLATSREPLRIASEQTYRLPSLAVPARRDTAGLSAAEAADYGAVELFTQRAQAVDFAFTLDDANTPIIAGICRRLDGIPLAIELAAARVNVLPLDVLATKIESHLHVLAGGDRLALPRHQTMHALIAWSYQLLSPAEQRLFEYMSVFAGGCALEQVVAVCGDEAEDEVATLNRLSSLVDKSLLIVDLHSDEPRYSLLQSFAQYASQQLESRGESTIVRQRHASAYTALAERIEEQYDLASTIACNLRLQLEFENCMSALEWTLEARRDVTLGQRLVAAMRPTWILTLGGERWLRIARDLANERTPALLVARLGFADAAARYAATDFAATLAMCRPLIAVYHELGDSLRAAYAQGYAASSLLFLGQITEAKPLLAAALEVARAHERWPLIAFVLRAGSILSNLLGDVNTGREKLVEALAIYERIGAQRHTSFIFHELAECEFESGNVENALNLALKCLNLQRALGSRIVHTLANLCAYNVALNHWDHARVYVRELLGLTQESQAAAALPLALLHLAAVAVLSARPGASSSTSACLAQSALLLGFVDARAAFVREYTEQQEFDRVLAALRVTVAAADLVQLMAQGALLTPEQATEIGLSIEI